MQNIIASILDSVTRRKSYGESLQTWTSIFRSFILLDKFDFFLFGLSVLSSDSIEVIFGGLWRFAQGTWLDLGSDRDLVSVCPVLSSVVLVLRRKDDKSFVSPTFKLRSQVSWVKICCNEIEMFFVFHGTFLWKLLRTVSRSYRRRFALWAWCQHWLRQHHQRILSVWRNCG